MSEPLVVTFDIGTQSARALLINAKGEILFKAQKSYETPYYSKQPGWAEQKAGFYWQSLCENSLRLKEMAGSLWNDVVAVTCCTIRDTVLCLDKARNPLRDVILWIDDRKTTGLPPFPVSTALLLKLAGISEGIALQRRNSHCNWIVQNEPEIWEKTDKFVLISTYINYKLCGNLIDSVSSIIAHVPFDSKIKNWMKPNDFRRLIFEIAPEKLFEFAGTGTVLGEITPAAAGETGLPAGIPLVASGSDKGCETLGLSVLSGEKAALSFGTTATVQISTQKFLNPLPFMPPYLAVVPGYYNPEIEIFRGYWLLSWFKKEFAAKECAEAERLGVSAEHLLNERLKGVPAGCNGLILQPYFTPGIDMPYAKGAVIGLSDVHTRVHLYRAIIEGINFALMEGLRGMEKRGKLKVKSLYVAGGGSQSDEICRITASMFGLPVYRTQTYEAAGIGSALTAFVSKGIFSSYEEAVGAMVHIKDEFLPNNREHKLYEQLHERVFVKIFEKIAPLYEDMHNILQGDNNGSSV
ncbi:carbohydrate kinase [Spirochaetia bacterium]|nr:carbohydrate kinase [Spirochaetia bacterium]